MPLTDFQSELGRLLAKNRSEDSYVAGGAAILTSPKTKRYSHDIDFFHDSAARVASAFEADRKTLAEHGGFVNPNKSGIKAVPHYDRPGGVVPRIME